MNEKAKQIKIGKNEFIWYTPSSHVADEGSYFDKFFQTTWKNAEKKNVLNYSLQDIYTKILPGDYKIVAQVSIK